MRVLHLFSNYKWTGPAEPAVNVCLGLRRLGIHADFACSKRGADMEGSVAEEVRRRGVEPIVEFDLPKYRGITMNWADVRALSRFLRETPYDIVHCHMANDHSIATAAAQDRAAIIRSSYYGTGLLRMHRRTRRCLRRTAFLIEPSQIALDYDARTFGYPPGQMAVVPAAIDTHRFDPARVTGSARERLGIPADAFVLGIVARMQRHRHFDVLLEAFRRASAKHPELHLIIVGRGTHQDAVAREPVRAMGLTNRVHFPGYLSGDDYVEMINAFDMKVFMTPGTDGTCRAVREAMAMGKAAIVNNVGMLPELVEDGQNGFVFDGTVESLHAAIEKAANNRGLAPLMGQRACGAARREFSLVVQAERIAGIYDQLSPK